MGVIWTRGALTSALLCAVAHGQQSIGRVTLQDASVSGPLEVSEGKARLQGGATIVARDHTAELSLERGGIVNICATSSLHVTSGAQVGEVAPLLFALDQGAIELKTVVVDRDIVITPDLRLSTPTGGPIDLRIRVTNNGDTCVENRGPRAPTIEVVEQFGEGRYLIPAGQHVLFEHGSLREVVDRESSPCGCPPTPVVSLAESGVTTNPTAAARAGGMAAQKKEEHPFPAAQSQGLAPTAGRAQGGAGAIRTGQGVGDDGLWERRGRGTGDCCGERGQAAHADRGAEASFGAGGGASGDEPAGSGSSGGFTGTGTHARSGRGDSGSTAGSASGGGEGSSTPGAAGGSRPGALVWTGLQEDLHGEELAGSALAGARFAAIQSG